MSFSKTNDCIESGRPTILYVSLWPWNALWQRPQHLAQQLSQQYNLLYASPIPFHARSSTLTHLVKVGRLEKEKNGDHLCVLSFPFLPSWRFSPIRSWNHHKWAAAISDYIANQDILVDVLWLSSPEQLPFCKKISARLICYDCMDNYESFFPQLKSVEQELFRRVDVVFVSAPLLKEKARKYNTEVYLVPNGVEVERFHSVLEEPYPLPFDMREIPLPIIGYYGTIADWMDYEILEELWAKMAVSIVLIGPVRSEKAKKLAQHPRIFLLGPKPYNDLPAYLAHFSVCVLPFKNTELTRAVDPVKIYEYLAAGKDVVTTPLPALSQHRGLLIEASPSEFCDAVRDTLRNPATPEVRERRSAAMSAHSWKKRAEQILAVFAEKGIC